MEMTQQDKAKLIRFLNFVCTLEASKPVEEMNEDLIDACVTVLLELQDKHVELSPEYIDNQVRKIFHPEDAETTEPETVKEPKKVVSKKKIWLVAACIAILVALLSIVSFSSERNVVDVLEDFFGTYEFIPFGKEVDVGEETYGKNGDTVEYKTIEDVVNNEKFTLLFPANTTNSIQVNIISVIEKQNSVIFSVSFDNPNISMEIITNSDTTAKEKFYCKETLTINDVVFYICEMKDVSQVQAYFMHNDNLYTISCSSRDILMQVLENMEEVRYED